eukprot:jgi/Botrbrau1/4492/Bobra.0220s0026.1
MASILHQQHGFTIRSGMTTSRQHNSSDTGEGGSLRSSLVGFKGLLELSRDASWSPDPAVPFSPLDRPLEVVGTRHSSAGIRRLVKAVAGGLRACQEPAALSEGLGGTYFFLDEAGRKVGIMKPCDEEPLAPNNPKGFVGRQLGDPGLKPTVRVGEAAIREVAAFLLDHENFASVPHTVLVRMAHPVFHQGRSNVSGLASIESASPVAQSAWVGSMGSAMSQSFGSEVSSATHTSILNGGGFRGQGSCQQQLPQKLGSLQEYVAHDCDTSELGASCFTTRDVHRIGILDLRLFNTDRHAGNMLVRKQARSNAGTTSALARLNESRMELIPIDHGFCLPETLEPPFLEWLHWPQSMIPFDEEELAYIRRLDAAADIQMLREELPVLRDECLCVLEVATRLLKSCAAAGLCLAEIGAVVSRPLVGLDEGPSDLEQMCWAARAEVEAMASVDCYISEHLEVEEESEGEQGNPWDQLPTLRSAHGTNGWLTRHFSMQHLAAGGAPPAPPEREIARNASEVSSTIQYSADGNWPDADDAQAGAASDMSISNADSGAWSDGEGAKALGMLVVPPVGGTGVGSEDLLFALDEDGGTPPAARARAAASPATPAGIPGAAWRQFGAGGGGLSPRSPAGPCRVPAGPASLANTGGYLRPGGPAPQGPPVQPAEARQGRLVPAQGHRGSPQRVRVRLLGSPGEGVEPVSRLPAGSRG